MWRAALAISHLWTILLCGQPFAGSVIEQHTSQPLRGARIQVRIEGAPRMTADLETGADGVFRAPVELPAGEYRITISKPNFASVTFRVPVPLTSTLAVRLAGLGSITGHVTDNQNHPLAGVNVVLMTVEADGTFRQLAIGAQTNETGQYRLFHLAPGRYVVAIGGAHLFPNNRHPEILSIASGSQLRGIDFVYPPQSAYSVSGRLQLSDSQNNGVVTLIPSDQPLLATATARTLSDGVFRLEGIAPGSYELMAVIPSHVGAEPVFSRTHVEVATQSLMDLTITPESGRTLHLSLQTVTGCPAGATLTLRPIENWGALLERTLEITTTAVTLRHLAPGRYRVTVTKPDEICFGTEHIIDLRKVESLRLDLVRGGTVEGRVESSHAVTLTPEASQQQEQHTIPGAEGRFRFSNVRPGRYRVHSGEATEKILVRSNASTDVVLHPPKGGR